MLALLLQPPGDENMKVLVSGGTGFLGQAIVQRLKQDGHAVHILSRKSVGDGVVQGDITKPETLAVTFETLKNVEAVIQCAQFPGHPFENRRKGYTYWQVDALGTENLVRAAEQAKVKQFIYISGAGTDGKKSEPWFRAKWHAEESVRRSDMAATILRPSWIYGPGDKSLNRIIGALRQFPIFPMMGNGGNHVQPLLISDLAEVVAACMAYAGGHRVFEVGGPKEMTMRQMLQTVLKMLGKKCRVVPVPKWVVKIVLNANAVDFITMDVHINITPLQKTFPHIQFKSLEEGLSTYL